MNRYLGYTLGVIALAFIPVLMYLALRGEVTFTDPADALWATLAVLAGDGLLFFLAFGAWNLTRWERCGLSIVLPLLLVMASWAAMMGMVGGQMRAAG